MLALALLPACDEKFGPQPDQPIKPQYGEAPPRVQRGPPEPKAKPPETPITAEPSEAAAAASEPAAAPAPAAPRCPLDFSEALTAKASKTKSKHVVLLVKVRADQAGVSLRKLTRAKAAPVELEDGSTSATCEVDAKTKSKVMLDVTCGDERRQVSASIDPKARTVKLEAVAGLLPKKK